MQCPKRMQSRHPRRPPRHGRLKRAEKEQAARAEWESLCEAVANLQKSADADDLRKRILAYPQAHEGTIFFLETMGQGDEPKVDALADPRGALQGHARPQASFAHGLRLPQTRDPAPLVARGQILPCSPT